MEKITIHSLFPKLGAVPQDKRHETIKASPNHPNGSFINRIYTPTLTPGHSMYKVMFNFFFKKGDRIKPKGKIPSVYTNLNNLPKGDWLVWFGHSSYFMQVDGLKILVDPVFSGYASPIKGITKAFEGSDIYTPEDMPEIDYLIISHDHYDHLDYDTILKLRPKIKQVICGLGVGAHFERWGYAANDIKEMDWDTEIELKTGFKLFGITTRHFSGRGFKRDQTLWMAYLLQTPKRKIFIGGDGGYDAHFKNIGERHGPIDLAIIENGQYNEAWKAIHFLPGENLEAAKDIKAQRILPVHSSKFSLALHDWDEPLKAITKLNEKMGLNLITPKIGELVDLNDQQQKFSNWWEGVD